MKARGLRLVKFLFYFFYFFCFFASQRKRLFWCYVHLCHIIFWYTWLFLVCTAPLCLNPGSAPARSLPPSMISMAPERRVMAVASGKPRHPSPCLPHHLHNLHAIGHEGYGAVFSKVGGSFSGLDLSFSSSFSFTSSSSRFELSSSSRSRSKGRSGLGFQWALWRALQ